MKTKQRLLSLALCGAMLFSLCAQPVFAEAGTQTQDSGMTIGISGWCEHHPEHTGDCGYTEGELGTPCGFVCEICSGGISAPSDTEKAVTVENVQAMIDALPEKVTEDNRAQVRRLLDEILALYGKLSEEEQEQVNLTRCLELQAALDPANLPMTAAGTLTIGGHQLTQTDGDVLGDGTVSYDADTNTITLNNCNLPNGEIYCSDPSDLPLTIELLNENYLQAIYVEDNCLETKGSGSLTMENDTTTCIRLLNGDLVISNKEVTLTSTSEIGCGIFTTSDPQNPNSSCNITISNSTVKITSKYTGLNGGKSIIIKDNSVVESSSSTSEGMVAFDGDIEISNSTVTANGDGYGICSNNSSIKIDNSKVEANSTYRFDNSTFYPGIFGSTGVSITNCSGTDKGVTATSASNIGIRSPAIITIDNSQVDAQGYYSGLMGAGGVGIQNGSKVNASSSDDCGIFSPDVIQIDGSEVTAEGKWAGLRGNAGVDIQNGSKVNASSSDDCGIFAETDLTVESSEIYANGSYLGIYIGNEGNVSGTWIRAEEGIGMGSGDFSTYKPVNSVTIQSGNWWVAGDAKVPDGALIKQDDQIEIPKDASLSIGGTKILGKAEGITVHTDGALLLPAGTVIESADGTKQTIGTGGGKITLDGEVSDFSTYTVTLETNGGTINSGNITSYTYGVGATLPTADDVTYTGHTFKGWYEDSSFSGNPVAKITTTDTGDKTYYAKWLSSDAGVTAVSVNNTPGDITGTTITVLLPLGTILPTDRDTISITPAAGAAVSNLQLAASDGSKWTFTVTAEDKTTTESYTINVSVAENPAAGDVAAAKAEIQNTIWTVEQTTANEEAAVKSWIEKQLAAMSLKGVTYKVSIENFTKATAGSSTNENGTGGSFIFIVSLSKGKVEDGTLAEDTVTGINGTITATRYQATQFTVSVSASPTEGGRVSGGGTYEENKSVTITATANKGYKFVRWTENGSEVSTEADYTFTITGHRTFTAVFAPNGNSGNTGGSSSGGSGSSSGDSGSSGGGSTSAGCPEPAKPKKPTTSQTKPVTPDADGHAAVDNGAVQSAINKAKDDAKKNGNTTNGVAVIIPITPQTGQTSFSITLNAQTLNLLVREKVKWLEINIEGVIVEGMDASLLKWLDSASANGDIILRVKRADQSGLSREAKAAIGTRPAYDLSLVYLSGGNETPVTDFGGHTIAVRLSYTPAKEEQAGNLYAVYVEDKGKVEWLTKSSYDPDLGTVVFETGHFSIYGIGYRNPAPAFTDIKNHWAADNIIFAASRGLLAGSGNNQFSPDTGMTEGMFVTALGRLAGIDPDSYRTGKFTDAYYAPYVNWAAEKGIVNDTTTVSPDAHITREQMAVILANYAKKLGHDLPVAHEAVTFADNARISSGAAKEVKSMQQAGIMVGKGGNRFDPKGTATRAEAATVLRRFVEIVIDPQTAQGWVQNHSGSWQYMKNGKPAAGWLQDGTKWYWLDNNGWMFADGWKQVSGRWYYFYSDGSMAVNTMIDGRKIGPDGAETN